MCASKKPSDSDPPISVDDDAGTHPIAGTVRASFDADPDAVVVAIVETVAIVTGRSVSDMRPLFEIVDGEALTDLVTSSRRHPLEVTFSYEDCRVSVSNRIDSRKVDLTVCGECDE
ncbi:HalOD1 output domain-containing protein [Halomontanus rarus]|uniref:HalOD1 output domain-containing protein n=1 Tax=Halomontanus rarus TaxID=3034020 RepID=UPI0023E8B08E|nr:HalOD1 output domain-containing protein [Halovivax sp. TS33]